MIVENPPKNTEISAGNAPIFGKPALTRSEVLQKLSECLVSTHRKLKSGRVRETDSTRLQLLRAQAYISQVYFTGLRDSELDQIKTRLDALEAAKK